MPVMRPLCNMARIAGTDGADYAALENVCQTTFIEKGAENPFARDIGVGSGRTEGVPSWSMWFDGQT